MTLVIHGKPAPQPRVRAYRRGDHAGVYTPESAAEQANISAQSALANTAARVGK